MTEFIERIPEKGYLIAMFPDRVAFEPYSRDGRILQCESAERILKNPPEEMHFFNETEHCRILHRSSRGDDICVLLREEEEKDMDPDLLFAEDLIVKPAYTEQGGVPERIRVINRYTWSDYDTLVLRNYRIASIPEGKQK